MKKQLKKLTLHKKAIANFKSVNGGRPPHSAFISECEHGCVDTYETGCSWDTAGANSDCRCNW